MTILLLGGGPGSGSSGTGSGGSEATAFLARTSGLDAAHSNALIAFIDGLVADGVWTKFDALYFYSTQGSTNALLSLVSSTYNSTANGSPTFTTDRGFTGTDLSNTVYIDTTFNPSTAGSPKFVRNSAHISAWSVSSNALDTIPMMGVSKGSWNVDLFPNYSDGKAYFFCNDAGISVTNSTRTGHFIANRSGANDLQGYLNGSSIVSSSSSASIAVGNGSIYTIGQNGTTFNWGAGCQLALASIGSSLSSTDVTNFYNRSRTLMTAVGVP